MSREGELRRHPRAEKSSPVQIIWQDRSGTDRIISGRSLDISTSGLRIEVSEPLDHHSYVTVQSPALGVHGRASVRSCTRKGIKYIVGLEFSGGLQWKAKS
jgi:PilZ domain